MESLTKSEDRAREAIHYLASVALNFNNSALFAAHYLSRLMFSVRRTKRPLERRQRSHPESHVRGAGGRPNLLVATVRRHRGLCAPPSVQFNKATNRHQRYRPLSLMNAQLASTDTKPPFSLMRLQMITTESD